MKYLMNQKKTLSYIATAFVTVFFLIATAQCLKAGNDFLAFYTIGELAINKYNIYLPAYTVGMYVFYLPYFSLIMMCFSWLQFYIAAILWCFLKVAGYHSLFKKFGSLLTSKNAWIVLFPFLFLIRQIFSEFKLGQVNLFVLLFLTFTYFFLQTKREWAAAFTYSLASIKVIPLFMFPYFIIKRKWSFVLKCGVIFFVWFVGVYLYFPDFKDLVVQFLSITQSEKTNLTSYLLNSNQSLWSSFARITLEKEIFSFSNFPFKVYIYQLYASIVLFLLSSPIIINAFKNNNTRINPYEFSLVMVLMLLVSPDFSYVHQVILLFPLFYLFKYVARSGARFKKIICINLAFASFCLTFIKIFSFNDNLFTQIKYYSVQTIGVILIAFSCALLIIKPKTKLISAKKNKVLIKRIHLLE